MQGSKSVSDRVNKKVQFEMYVIWKSLPPILRGKPEYVLRQQGFDDQIILELLGIKTQKQFAEKHDLEESTLSGWNKIIHEEGLLDGLYSWARGLTQNVTLALYKNVMKNGRAQEVRAWYELIENK